MSLSAIILIRDWPASTTTPGDFPHQRRKSGRVPIACTEIFGQSVLRRTIARLRQADVKTIVQVAATGASSIPETEGVETNALPPSLDPWRTAQQALMRQAAFGVETVIVLAIGAYVEFNLEAALQFHCSQGSPLTQMGNKEGPLDCWIVDAKWFRNVAGTLPFNEKQFPGLPVLFPVDGYVNRLADVRDLRTLVLDTFLSKCEIKPAGRELRPGVWVEDGARIHKMARLVAPVYIGRSTRVGRSAVITSYSNLESHTGIGEGTTVHSSSVLSHTVVGKGLDVSNAVVEGTRFVDLTGSVSMEVHDSKLLRDTLVHQSIPVECYGHVCEPLPASTESRTAYTHYLSRAAGMLAVVFSRTSQ